MKPNYKQYCILLCAMHLHQTSSQKPQCDMKCCSQDEIVLIITNQTHDSTNDQRILIPKRHIQRFCKSVNIQRTWHPLTSNETLRLWLSLGMV